MSATGANVANVPGMGNVPGSQVRRVMEQNRINMLRKKLYDSFKHYREGKIFDVVERSRARFGNTSLPLSGDPPQVFIPGTAPRLVHYQQSKKIKVMIDEISDARNVSNSMLNAWMDLQRVKTYFENRRDARRFQYRRCLGWGGNGIAAAWDVLDGNGTPERAIVVKSLFNDEENALQAERHARSEHIVQLEFVNGEGLIDNKSKSLTSETGEKRPPDDDDDGGGNPADTSRRRLPNARPPPSTIILELLENGDLADFMIRVREHGEQVPNRVLWRFCLCLVRMCIGLAFPPSMFPELGNVPGPIKETVPEEGQDLPMRIVHFDFDPRNVFVGKVLGEGDHKITPILKLGDFGLAKHIADNQNDWYYERMRACGKRGFFAPEQFCADWDYIETEWDLVSTHEIAGNYHWHTNVWGLGLVMECLITLCYPLIPPYPRMSSQFPPTGKVDYWTYGAHIATPDYDHVDKDIAGLIQRCQAHLPADRPQLKELEEFVERNLQREYIAESDEDVLEWIHKILYEPPPDPAASAPVLTNPVQQLDGPGGIIGTGPGNPPRDPTFFPRGIRLQRLQPAQPPVPGPPLQRPDAPPPPRQPERPMGIFDTGSRFAGGAGGIGPASPAQPNAPAQSQAPPAMTAVGPRTGRRGGWGRFVHPYGRPPGAD
ncbi:kinase-like protein [Xylariaceae sp. AK1471]|nr:kinase-like protein [Xylariaceae sp. AK1471]